MPVGRQRSECSSYNSRITGGVENAVLIRADIPRTGGRGFVLQEYLQFP
jgi:hypothetical protein